MKNVGKVIKGRYWLIILLSISIFSFMMDLHVLTRSSLAYGIDGVFYSIQIQNILTTGFPVSNDPPLAYYMLTPFVMLTGNSFLGVKIGISLIGSLMAFPAFLLTECYVKQKNIGSKVPALLSAFLITVNINYFTMMGGYSVLQNLVGVFFLTFLLYFLIKWLENIKQWKKYGVITAILLCCNVLTHIYTGALAVTLFLSLILFTIIFKTCKTGKLPLFDLKILGIIGVLTVGCVIAVFAMYPAMYSKFITVLSFFGLSSSTETMGMGGMASSMNGTIFFSLPYLIGVFATIMILIKGLKEKIEVKGRVSSNTLLVWSYLTLAVVLAVLAFMPSEYQDRFVLMSFLPIALIVPLGLKYIETEIVVKRPTMKKSMFAIISMITVVFALSSFCTAATIFPIVGPTITDEQYNELLMVKQSYISSEMGGNASIKVDGPSALYWVEYTLDVDVKDGNPQSIQENNGTNENSTYVISFASNNSNQANSNQAVLSPSYNGSFLLPYGPSILPGSIDKIPSFNQQSQNSMNNQMGPGNAPSMDNSMQPGSMQNGTKPPENISSTNNPMMRDGNMLKVSGTNGKSSQNKLLSSYKVIFSGNYVKIYKIS